jgi:pimeloyl-ACP methyl ester carboxylesterase
MADDGGMSFRSAVRHSAGLIAISLGFEDLVHEKRPEDFPRVTTRDHFTVEYDGSGSRVPRRLLPNPIRGVVETFQDAGAVRMTDGRAATDYETAGEIPGWDTDDPPEEILVFVHGWLADEENGLGRFSLLRYMMREHGYEHPVVGFSWDADQQGVEWRNGVEIAAKNGPKLAQFLHDYRERNPDTRIRVLSNSLGSEVVLEALHALDRAGLEDEVDTLAMMGAASPASFVSRRGRYGDPIGRAADEVHSFWIPHDGTLLGPYRLADEVDAIGSGAHPEDTPPNFHAHRVDVPDHFSFYLKDDGCIPELLEVFED